MKREKLKGIVGKLYGITILPETPEEWLKLLEEEKEKALSLQREELLKKKDLECVDKCIHTAKINRERGEKIGRKLEREELRKRLRKILKDDVHYRYEITNLLTDLAKELE